MANFIKPAQTLQEVGLTKDSGVTRVDQFTRIVNSKNSNKVFEQSTGDFENNTIEYNAAYFTSEDTNPLISGLKLLDRAAMTIAGKRACSAFAFTEGLICSTPEFIKKTTLEEANDIILKNLGMREPVLAGVPLGRPQAIKFNTISLNITRDIRIGKLVYDRYIDDVISYGVEAMKEWIYRG